MKQRHAFRGTAWESLEDRQLLNGASGSAALARLQQRAALVGTLGQNPVVRVGRVPRGVWAGGRANRIVPPDTVGTTSTTPQANGRASTLPSYLNVKPAASRTLPTTNPGATTGSPIPGQFLLNTKTLGIVPGLGTSGPNPVGPGGYGALRPGSYPAQLPAGATTTTLGGTAINAPTASPVSALNTRTFTLAGLPTAPTATASTATLVPPPSGSPANPTLPATTLSRLPVTPGSSELSLVAEPDMPPLMIGMLGSATLEPGQVSAFKQAIDGFAGAYTSGADPAADTAASDALRSSLDDIARSVWSQEHVATPASVAELRKTVEGFAASYTSGADPKADTAAWRALQKGLVTFASGLNGPSTTPISPTDPPDGDFVMTRGMLHGRPLGGPGFMAIEAGLLAGPALSKDEVASLKTSVDAFAASYTSGADAAKDQAATEALETSIAGMLANHWQMATPPMIADLAVSTALPLPVPMPAPPPQGLPLNESTPVYAASASSSASPTTVVRMAKVQKPTVPPRGPLGVAPIRGINAANLFATAGAPSRRI